MTAAEPPPIRARLEDPGGERVPVPEGAIWRASSGEVRIDLAQLPALSRPGAMLWLPRLRVVLIRSRRKLRAFSTICPHKPKKGYRVRPRKRGARPVLRCAAHGWCFDRKGVPANKKARRPLSRVALSVKGDVVRVPVPG